MRRLLASFAALFTLAAAAPAQTRPSPDSVLDALHAVKTFRQAAISPDGTRVAWVERRRDGKGQETLSAIFQADTTGGKPRRISAAKDARVYREREVAWSPDGKSLA